jgi:ATP-dependent Lon protease
MSLKDSSTLYLVEEDRAETAGVPMQSPFRHPALATLTIDRWHDAFVSLHYASEHLLGSARAQSLLDALRGHRTVRAEIHATVDALYAHGTVASGEYALAWSLLTCDPRRPETFRAVLPQVQFALDSADLSAEADADVRDRLRIWWRAADGEFVNSKMPMSMFATARFVLDDNYVPDPEDPEVAKPNVETVPSWFSAPYAGPTLVVMPKSRSSKLNNHNKPFQDILDKELPLVLARGLDEARKKLGYEFPHAAGALQMLFRDLREGQPVRLKPTVLVGPPGAGKSRVVRRFAAAVGVQHVHRFDGSSSGDNHFAGTSKAWSNTEASVPARACLQSMTANPVVMVDEIDKAASSHHGSLFNAMLTLLEPETAARYRDQSLDAELDLSAVSYIATANDASVLPDFLRDRFRIVRIPAPRLVDLPLLAGSIVDEMLMEDEWAGFAPPFAPDELAVMAKAWQAAGFSLRKLQKIVRATLDARDAHSMRH